MKYEFRGAVYEYTDPLAWETSFIPPCEPALVCIRGLIYAGNFVRDGTWECGCDVLSPLAEGGIDEEIVASRGAMLRRLPPTVCRRVHSHSFRIVLYAGSTIR